MSNATEGMAGVAEDQHGGASVVYAKFRQDVGVLTSPDGEPFVSIGFLPAGWPMGISFPLDAFEARRLAAALVESAEELEKLNPASGVVI